MSRRRRAKAAQSETYQRAYRFNTAPANFGKVNQVLDLFGPYTAYAKQVMDLRVKVWLRTGAIDKNAPVPAADSPLSARYRQTCQYQVVGMLKAWTAQRADDFKRLVERSSLDPATRQSLLEINAQRAWYRDPPGVDPAILRLARNLMRHLRAVHGLPDTRHLNLHLDAKVARVERAKAPNPAFPYYLRLATLDKGKPVLIPLLGNPHFERAPGKVLNFVQVNLGRDGLWVCRIKEAPRTAYQFPQCLP